MILEKKRLCSFFARYTVSKITSFVDKWKATKPEITVAADLKITQSPGLYRQIEREVPPLAQSSGRSRHYSGLVGS